MEKVGSRDVVYRGNFIVPENEGVMFTADVEGWLINFNVQFENDGTNQGVRIEPQPGNVKLIFTNWNSSIGTTTVKPAALGTHQNGKKLSFMATNYGIGKVNKFDIHLMLGGE
jgi:hypothetical protein